MIKKISTKVFITYTTMAILMLLQGCKEMSSLTSDGIKKATTPGTTVDTTTPSSNSVVLSMTAPSVVEVNQCVPLIITLRNSRNEAVAATENMNILVTGAPGTLYSNNTCSTIQSTTVAFSKNALSKTIYVTPTANQSYVIDLEDVSAKITPNNFILSVTNPVGSSDSLKLTVTGPGSLQAGQCRSYVVSLQNTLGANRNASALLALSMSGQGSGSFHAGTNCSGGAISTLNLPMGSSFVSFSYQNSTAENVNFVVDSPLGSAIQSAFYSTQVTALSAAVPTQLVLTGPTSVTAGACSGPVVIKTVDASFNSTAVPSNLPFTITGGAGFSIFTNASCSTTLASPGISALTSSSSFYFITASPGNIVISADDGGSLTDAAISVQATASSGTSAVKFTLSGPASVLAGECSAGFTVKTTNGSGIESAVSATTVVNITGKGSGDFYDDAGCVTPISTVTFASGDSAKSFYYKGASVANLTFNVDDSGPLTPASTSVAIVPDAPTNLAVTGPSPITLGECRAYTVTAKDANSFVSSVSGTTSINLTGAGAGAFYADSSCVNSTSSVVINSGQSGALFYYKSLSAASVTLSADNSGALTAGTRAIVVDPLPYSKVVFTRPVLNAGICTAVTITLKDSLNNTALAASPVGVTLTSTGTAAFYSANTCAGGTLITSSSITTGTSSVIVYLRDNAAGSITLGAASTGLSSDSWNATVNPGSNGVLKVVGPATNSVGDCTAYDLRLEDSLGNLSPASGALSVNFTGLSNAKFYSDAACTSIANSMTLATGVSQAQIYLKGSVAEAITATASSGALTPAATAISLIAGSSNKLVITGVATASAGACTALNVAVQDNFNNPINQGSNLVVTMLGNGTGSFYSEATCTTPASTVTITTGSSSGILYYRSNAPASLSFTAQAGGLFDGTKGLTVNPLAPTKLVMTGSTTIAAGVCTAYSISLQDTLNNLSAAGAAKTLNFSGALSGAFYSDSSCALSAASISLTSNQTTASIYYKASVAQTPNLVVDDSGLPDLASSTLPVTVTSGGGGATIALKISGATSANTSTCIPYAVMTTDSSGLSYNVSSNLTATLGGEGTGGFYSDSGCTVVDPTVTINSGSSLSYIYYMSVSAQNLVFSATASGASATTLPVAITSGSGASTVSRLTMTGATSILTNTCIPYIVSVADTNGNSMNAAAPTSIILSGNGSGDFYSDAACTISAAGAATVASGSSYTTVYYQNSAVQNLILIAQSTGLSNGTLAINTSATSGGSNAGPAVKLAFVAQPSTVASTSENFGIQPIVAVQDSNNNVASSSGATITLAAFTDSACTLSAGAVLAATTNPLNASGGVANFAGVNISSAQSLYIRASSPGLASACSSAIQVYPSVPAKLAFTQQPATTATAGVNLATMPQVSVLNHTNQVVTSATGTVTLAAFSDNTCTTPISGVFNITSSNLIPTSGVASFTGINYSLVSTLYLKATSSGLTSACSSGVTVSAGAPATISLFTQPSTTGKVGDAFSLVARLYDSFGNLAPAAHNLSLTAYKSVNCSGTTSLLTGNTTTAVLGTGTFSNFSFTETGVMSVKVTDTTDGGVTSICTNPMTIDGGTPAKLAISVQPSASGRIYSVLEVMPSIRIEDADSNLVTLATNPITVAAFTNNTCTTPVSGVLSAKNLEITPLQGVAQFESMAYDTQETIYLGFSSPGLTSACSNGVTLSSLPEKIAVGNQNSCAVVNGGVWCWGEARPAYGMSGELGYANNHNYPVQVLGVGGVGYLSNVSEVTVGTYHACALASSGVFCWGTNTYGQLGDGTNSLSRTPVQVVGVGGTGVLSNIVSVKAGDSHTCALTSTNNLLCWGIGSNGIIGDGAGANRASPVYVKNAANTAPMPDVVGFGVGSQHTCLVNTAENVYCWGAGTGQQIGDGGGTARSLPVQVRGVAGTGFLGSIASVSPGSSHTCAVTTTGSMYCWGIGTSGQLGDNGGATRSYPVVVSGIGALGTLAGVKSTSAGSGFTCALMISGNVTCWGLGAQLGTGTGLQNNAPALVKDITGAGTLSNIISLSAGANHSCALDKDGAMFCWGANASGQLGNKITINHVPVRVKDGSFLGYSAVSAGGGTICAISQAKAYCWGVGTSGQIGDGTVLSKTTPTLVSGLTDVKDVVTSGLSSCALLTSGAVYCWGNNGNGQLGNGTITASNVPVPVTGITNASSIALSDNHACASLSSGEVYCWGVGTSGQLGDGTSVSKTSPVKVINISGASAVSVTVNRSCAIVNSGALYCWGASGSYVGGALTSTPSIYNNFTSGVTAVSLAQEIICLIKAGAGYCYGANIYSTAGTWHTTSGLIWPSGVTQLAAGREYNCAIVDSKVKCFINTGTPPQFTSVYTSGALYDVQLVSVTPNNSYHTTCAIKKNGALFCWGYNGSATIFNGASSSNYPLNFQMPDSQNTTNSSISVGETFSCGIANGAVNCWGSSTAGALGSGYTTSTTPMPVKQASNSSNLVAQQLVSAGGGHACSLSNSKEVYCWGDNLYGRLGNNSTTSSNKAVQVLGVNGSGFLSSVESLSSGYRHTCATSGSYVYCWGYNSHGQLGISTTMNMGTPTMVKGLSGVGNLSGITQVASGRLHTCALSSAGTVYCWGNNANGQLGNNSAVTQSNNPVQVVYASGVGVLDNVTSITAGAYHTCALSGGMTYCWGSNASKQLGNDSNIDSSYPVGVMNSGYVTLNGVTEVVAGARHTCAKTSINEVFCWGSSTQGQTGTNLTLDVSVASSVIGVGGVGSLSAHSLATGSSANHSCGISTDQATINCWGAGSSGQMGNGTSPATQMVPTPVTSAEIPYLLVR